MLYIARKVILVSDKSVVESLINQDKTHPMVKICWFLETS